VLAQVPVRLDAGTHKGMTEVPMACMCLALAPVTQSGSSASRLGCGGNMGRETTVDHRDIQQGSNPSPTVRRGKGYFNVGPRPPTARSCNASRCISGLCTRTAARTRRDAAESFFPVIVSTRAASAQAIATHGVVDINALDVTLTKTSGGGDMWVDAHGSRAEVAVQAQEVADARGDNFV
jgi:hypothetical protein